MSHAHAAAAAAPPPTSSLPTTPLMQHSNIISSFLHHDVVVGVLQPPPRRGAIDCLGGAGTGPGAGQQQQDATAAGVVGVRGRLDAIDVMCNVALSGATTGAAGAPVSRVAALRGATVMFVGIPKRSPQYNAH